MSIAQDLAGCFGDKTLDQKAYRTNLDTLQPVYDGIRTGQCTPTMALLDLAHKTEDLEQIIALAADIRKHFRHIVVCGSGGSGLSGRILAQLQLGQCDMGLHFLENIDPDLIEAVVRKIDIPRTCFVIISKSGTTVETLAQYYVLQARIAQAGGDVSRQCIAITMTSDSPLRKEASAQRMRILEHPADIGGRFSALTAVGLLPAALAGLDIKALRKGAQQVAAQLQQAAHAADCMAAQAAALQYTALQSGRNISVLWPYAERLAGFAGWYRQSWAESLGKQGRGSSPLIAIGTTDQHSQLQLFLDGPKDKLFTIITLKRSGTGAVIPAPAQLAHLNGRRLGDVMQA
ncbi:MAG: hypothetical protein AB7L92_06180, partial [Alphaproteobacteria bacterium]